ncbi:MAG: hypothetical protein H7Y38_01070 [Armatimonadetes bacterium]|nr:hypothetical protein [Armatimonadota bacterium]
MKHQRKNIFNGVGFTSVRAVAHAEAAAIRSRSARFYQDPGNTDPPAPGGGGNTPPAPDATVLASQLTALQAQLTTLTSERDTLKSAETERENATKTDMQKAADRAAEAEKKVAAAEATLRETYLRLDVERAARKLSIVDEDAAFRLMDTGAVKFDANGKPQNVEALLAELVKAKPYLAGEPGGSGGSPTNPARPRGGGLTRDALAKMTAKQIAALPQDEVLAAMSK